MTVILRETVDPRDVDIPMVPGDHRDPRDPRNTHPHTIFFTDKKRAFFTPPFAIVP